MMKFRPQTSRRLGELLVVVSVASCLALPAADATANTTPHAAASPPSLSTAARTRTEADNALVSGAMKLRGCLRTHRSRCTAARQAVQHAGKRLARAERRLAKLVRGRVHAGHVSDVTQAPQLVVSGQTLRWTRVHSVKTYVFARHVPGQGEQYSVVSGTSITPPPVPGVTVSYSVQTNVSGSAWAKKKPISYPAKTETADTQAAPVLTVSGHTLTWTEVGGVSTYVVVQKAPGTEERYSVVSGTSFTPTPVPGATVHYSVRTAVDGSAWALEVAIVYPAAAPEPTPTQPSPSPAPSESSGTGSFEMGLVPASLASTEPGVIQQLGAHTVRMEFAIGTSPSTFAPIVEQYAKAGIRILPLAGFEGTLPTSAQAESLASWAAEFGSGGSFWQGKSFPAGTAMTNIEFGNETSYTYQFSENSSSAVASRAQTYAIRFKEAYEAIHAANPNVGLLAQADDGNTGSSTWVDNMFKAVPNLGQIVAGWTVHPYGPEWQARIDRLISQTQADGASSSIPIYVTEWGLATDNGRCLSNNYGWNPCMTYAEAATALNSTVTGMLARYGSRLRALYLYQAQDLSESGTSTDREEYFGSLQRNGAPKGAYTTEVQSLLSLYG
jgi:hypothetical protein